MSKTLENAFNAVQNTQIVFNEKRHFISVENAYIFWTNFSGRATKFNNHPVPNFNLAIPEDAAKVLADRGWRIREEYVYNEDAHTADSPKVYFVNVKVNMNSQYPPEVAIFTEYNGKKSKRSLDIESLGELDRVDIVNCDMYINEYPSKFGDGKVSGYLLKLYAVQEPQMDFGGKYDDWDNVKIPVDEDSPY